MFYSKNHKSSHWRCSVKEGIYKSFVNFTGKHLCPSLFLIKLQALTGTQVFSCDMFFMVQFFKVQVQGLHVEPYFSLFSQIDIKCVKIQLLKSIEISKY